MKLHRLSNPLASLIVATASLTIGFADADDAPARPDVKPVAVAVLRADALDDLTAKVAMTATILEVTLAPEGGSPPHRHPGSVSGYVAEGTFEFAVGDEDVRTLKAGDTFFEPTMVLHRVGRNPSATERTRLIVTMVHPSEAKQLVIPEPKND